MSVLSHSPLLTAVAALAVASCGCFGGGDQWTKKLPETVEASGVVRHNGTPVEAASVVFAPVEPGEHAARGRTDKNGKFSMQACPSKEAAVPGKYQVAVSKTIETTMTYEMPADLSEDAEHAEEAGEDRTEEGVGWKNVLPQRCEPDFVRAWAGGARRRHHVTRDRAVGLRAIAGCRPNGRCKPERSVASTSPGLRPE